VRGREALDAKLAQGERDDAELKQGAQGGRERGTHDPEPGQPRQGTGPRGKGRAAEDEQDRGRGVEEVAQDHGDEHRARVAGRHEVASRAYEEQERQQPGDAHGEEGAPSAAHSRAR